MISLTFSSGPWGPKCLKYQNVPNLGSFRAIGKPWERFQSWDIRIYFISVPKDHTVVAYDHPSQISIFDYLKLTSCVRLRLSFLRMCKAGCWILKSLKSLGNLRESWVLDRAWCGRLSIVAWVGDPGLLISETSIGRIVELPEILTAGTPGACFCNAPWLGFETRLASSLGGEETMAATGGGGSVGEGVGVSLEALEANGLLR